MNVLLRVKFNLCLFRIETYKAGRTDLGWVVKLNALLKKLLQLETLLGVFVHHYASTSQSTDQVLNGMVALLVTTQPPRREVLTTLLCEDNIMRGIFVRLSILYEVNQFQALAVEK